MSIKEKLALMSRKKIILSLGLIVAVAAAVIGATYSYFSDVETSSGNKFVAGKFNLKIDNTCHYNGKECAYNENLQKYFWTDTEEECFCSWEEKDLDGELFFNLDDVKPGDKGEDTISLHVINNDAWMCAQIANLKNYENNCEQPEIQSDQTCGDPGEGEGELQDHLFFTIWKDNGAGTNACNNILDADETALVSNQAVQNSLWPIADASTGGIPLVGDETYCVGAAWNVPIATGNIIQTDSLTADIRFVAVQARNMETFSCAQLFTETCDGIDNDYNGIIDDNWPTLGQTCSVGVGACQTEGAYVCDANNSSGPVVCSATAGNPGLEICDGIDNNCNGLEDDGLDESWFNQACDGSDSDLCAEGVFQCQSGVKICSDTSGNSMEVCDGVDNDCDGQIDEGLYFRNYYNDADNDNYGNPNDFRSLCAPSGSYKLINVMFQDCNDNNANIHPFASETCNGIDDDCDGQIDENLMRNYYKDADNDGYGNPNDFRSLCAPSGSYKLLSIIFPDCNDSNSSVHPHATEICNGVDDDCWGGVDNNFPEQWMDCRSCGFSSRWYQCVNGALYCPPCN